MVVFQRIKMPFWQLYPADEHEVTVYDRGQPIHVPSSFWEAHVFPNIRQEFGSEMFLSVGLNHGRLLNMLMMAMKYG
jgi:hypothetical protein